MGASQALRAVDGEQPYGVAAARIEAHLLDVAALGHARQLRDHVREVEAVRGEPARRRERLQQVPRAAVAELARRSVRDPAEAPGDAGDRGGGRQRRHPAVRIAGECDRARDATVGSPGGIQAMGEAAAGAHEAIERLVVDAEKGPAQHGEPGDGIVGIGERGEQRKQRRELLRVRECSSARELARDALGLEPARVVGHVPAVAEENEEVARAAGAAADGAGDRARHARGVLVDDPRDASGRRADLEPEDCGTALLAVSLERHVSGLLRRRLAGEEAVAAEYPVDPGAQAPRRAEVRREPEHASGLAIRSRTRP